MQQLLLPLQAAVSLRILPQQAAVRSLPLQQIRMLPQLQAPPFLLLWSLLPQQARPLPLLWSLPPQQVPLLPAFPQQQVRPLPAFPQQQVQSLPLWPPLRFPHLSLLPARQFLPEQSQHRRHFQTQKTKSDIAVLSSSLPKRLPTTSFFEKPS